MINDDNIEGCVININRRVVLLKALFVALMPILAIVVYTAFQGHNVLDVFIPDSGWNDELFYYKMVEAVLDYKFPRGFFGFNESRALNYSFAAWSPIILVQWVIWGLIFGWNLLSPILSNVVFLAIALFVFVILVRPSNVDCFFLATLLLCFKPLARYTLSCVPEVELFGLVILYVGLCLSLIRGKIDKLKYFRLFLIYFIVVFMTLIRPYLILFLIEPCILWIVIRNDKTGKGLKGSLMPIIVTSIVFFVTIITYVLIGKFLCAPYLESLYYTDWLKMFIKGNILDGFHFTLSRIKKSVIELLVLIKGYLKGDAFYAAGLYYLLYGITLVVTTIHLLINVCTKSRKISGMFLTLEAQVYFVAVSFGIADLLMYRIEPGGRHTLIFSLCFLMLMPFANSGLLSHDNYSDGNKAKPFIVPILSLIVLIIMFGIKGDISYEYDLAYMDSKRTEEMQLLTRELSRSIDIDEEDVSYDNTVIWSVWSKYGDYYALPSGTGISCCTDDYLMANYDSLKSRYIGVTNGGYLESLVLEKGGEYMCGSEDVSFYKIK